MNYFFSLFIQVVQAADPYFLPQPGSGVINKVPFYSSVGLDLVTCGTGGSNIPDGGFLACYISALYTFFVQGAIILAVVFIMVGGFQWLLAAGNSSKISEAKSTISAAIFGLILALTSYLLFAQINNKLVDLQSLDINPVNIDLPTSNFAGQPYTPNNLRTGTMLQASKQIQFIHPQLAEAMNKFDSMVDKQSNVNINSFSDDNVFGRNCRRESDGGALMGDCQHGGLYHYGGPNNTGAFDKNNPPYSCAVDIGASFQYYRELQNIMTQSGLTFSQCEHTCSLNNPRCGEVLDCTTGKNKDGVTGKIGHLHGHIVNCSKYDGPSGIGGGSGAD